MTLLQTLINDEQRMKLQAELYQFPDNQFTQRLQQALGDPRLSLASFWLLLRDCLWGARLDNYPPFLDLGIMPSLVQFRFATQCGLKMDRGSHNVTLTDDELDLAIRDVYGLKTRKRMRPVPMDPALKMKLRGKYDSYTSAAQRTAVRTTLLAPEGSTLLINLPTGCGKTLVGHAAVMFAKPQQLSVIVMPTIGLAIEQGDRVRKMLQTAGEKVVGQYAWHSGLSKEDKSQIRKQVRTGQQKVLLVSPESMLSSLLPELFRLAESGKLGTVIVDEAHLIDAWGSGFRPDFQRIAALIASLRDTAKGRVKTVLMSATFTERNLHTIRALFCAPDQQPLVMNGSFLRQEMSTTKYLVSKGEHTAKVLERVQTLPKPMILYTTKVEDCQNLASELIAQGLSRIATFHGNTTTNAREETLKAWQNNELDIIVATSAFGVGMDKDDVRSVLHASIPENIDRYYQEIGRSGRDGQAAHCEVVFHREQINIAKDLNQDAIIKIDKGLARWQCLWQRREKLISDSRYVQAYVDLRLQPNHLDQQSDSNTKWNWLTLLLMQRAGLIQLSYPKPDVKGGESNEVVRAYWENYANRVVVTVLNDHHQLYETWLQEVQAQRRVEIDAQTHGFNVLYEWLFDSEVHLCQSLHRFYQLQGERPTFACGGCPACRGKDWKPPQVEVGYRVALYGHETAEPSSLNLVYFTPSEPNVEVGLVESFVHLHAKGKVVALAGSSGVLEQLQKRYSAGLSTFWVYLSREEWLSDCEVMESYGKFIVDDSERGDASVPEFYLSRNYYCANSELRDPDYKHRRWWESTNSAMSLMNFKNNIEAM